MAIYPENKNFLIESIKENLYTIDYCVNYDKSIAQDWIGESKLGCLGIPAFILICSLIDTIGSYFRNSQSLIQIDNVSYKIEKASDHFFILNHDKFFNLDLKMTTIMDFYSTYRSKIVHNTTLPENSFLDIGRNEDRIFQLDKEGKIIKLNIIPLFEKTKSSFEYFIYILENMTFSSEHTVNLELIEKRKTHDPSAPNNTSNPAASGFTESHF